MCIWYGCCSSGVIQLYVHVILNVALLSLEGTTLVIVTLTLATVTFTIANISSSLFQIFLTFLPTLVGSFRHSSMLQCLLSICLFWGFFCDGGVVISITYEIHPTELLFNGKFLKNMETKFVKKSTLVFLKFYSIFFRLYRAWDKTRNLL